MKVPSTAFSFFVLEAGPDLKAPVMRSPCVRRVSPPDLLKRFVM